MAKKSKSAPPALPAPATKALASLAEADDALFNLGVLYGRQDEATAKFKAEIQRVTDEHAKTLFIEMEGVPVAIADRCQELEEQLRAFGASHRSDICVEDKKSIDLNFGKLGYRDQSTSMKPIEKGAAPAVKKLIEDLCAQVLVILKACKIFKKLPASPALTFKIDFDKAELKRAFKAKELTAAELKKVGYEMVTPPEQFFFEVHQKDLKSLPGATL